MLSERESGRVGDRGVICREETVGEEVGSSGEAGTANTDDL